MEADQQTDSAPDTAPDTVPDTGRADTGMPSGGVDGEPDSADDPPPVDTSDVTSDGVHEAADGASPANVVELFPDKAETEAHPDAGALFARLRAGSADTADGATDGGTDAPSPTSTAARRRSSTGAMPRSCR